MTHWIRSECVSDACPPRLPQNLPPLSRPRKETGNYRSRGYKRYTRCTTLNLWEPLCRNKGAIRRPTDPDSQGKYSHGLSAACNSKVRDTTPFRTGYVACRRTTGSTTWLSYCAISRDIQENAGRDAARRYPPQVWDACKLFLASNIHRRRTIPARIPDDAEVRRDMQDPQYTEEWIWLVPFRQGSTWTIHRWLKRQ